MLLATSKDASKLEKRILRLTLRGDDVARMLEEDGAKEGE